MSSISYLGGFCTGIKQVKFLNNHIPKRFTSENIPIEQSKTISRIIHYNCECWNHYIKGKYMYDKAFEMDYYLWYPVCFPIPFMCNIRNMNDLKNKGKLDSFLNWEY